MQSLRGQALLVEHGCRHACMRATLPHFHNDQRCEDAMCCGLQKETFGAGSEAQSAAGTKV